METTHGGRAGAAAVKETPPHGDPLESQIADAPEAQATSTAKADADEPAAQPIVPERPGVNDASAPTDEAIARRAYELYCARGCVDGFDQDDWHRAEQELRTSIVYTVHVSSPESPID